METLVLLPKGDTYNSPRIRVVGTAGGLDDLVTVRGSFIVAKVAGGSYWGGVGQPRKYARTQFVVWQVTDTDFRYDKSAQQTVQARRCVEFDKSS